MQGVNIRLCQINVAWDLKAEVTLPFFDFENLWTFGRPWPLEVCRAVGSHTGQNWGLSMNCICKKKTNLTFLRFVIKHCHVSLSTDFQNTVVCVAIFVFRYPLESPERWLADSATSPPPTYPCFAPTQTWRYFGCVTWHERCCQCLCRWADRSGQDRAFWSLGLPTHWLLGCVCHQTQGSSSCPCPYPFCFLWLLPWS